MVKLKKEIAHNQTLSTIIFFVARGVDYPNAVAARIGLDPSYITKAFKKLEEAKLINRIESENNVQYNIQKYSVNYDDVFNLFLDSMFNDTQNRIKEIEFLINNPPLISDELNNQLMNWRNSLKKYFNHYSKEKHKKQLLDRGDHRELFPDIFQKIIPTNNTLSDLFKRIYYYPRSFYKLKDSDLPNNDFILWQILLSIYPKIDYVFEISNSDYLEKGL